MSDVGPSGPPGHMKHEISPRHAAEYLPIYSELKHIDHVLHDLLDKRLWPGITDNE